MQSFRRARSDADAKLAARLRREAADAAKEGLSDAAARLEARAFHYEGRAATQREAPAVERGASKLARYAWQNGAIFDRTLRRLEARAQQQRIDKAVVEPSPTASAPSHAPWEVAEGLARRLFAHRRRMTRAEAATNLLRQRLPETAGNYHPDKVAKTVLDAHACVGGGSLGFFVERLAQLAALFRFADLLDEASPPKPATGSTRRSRRAPTDSSDGPDSAMG